jgi:hypothetical protein
MIHTSHIIVLTEQGFAERKLRDLMCSDGGTGERQAGTRGWGLRRR